MTDEQLREAVARAISDVRGPLYDGITLEAEKDRFRAQADAAIALMRPVIRAAALEEAARVAEGPVYRTSGTGEVALRGTDNGNWSVPMPTSGFRGSDYGTGRYAAAAAIRALKEKQDADKA